MKYVMKERMFSLGDDHWIEDERGEKAFLVDGKVLRLRETFELKDQAGRVVAVVKKKVVTVRDAMKIEDAEGEVIATVREKLFTPFRDKYKVELEAGGELEIHGNLLDRDYRIEDEHGRELAQVSRRWFSIRDAYGIHVHEGGDTALLLAIAVCLDHMVAEEH
ncbi:hypothetical protein CFP65_4072 [Kitasatospora sp. MMS16-BH015]|uniref:LURP-one-related/scramblase family protein n=1 Tax=Kitasatospora sp. MMS16-BH015 TaxID=2018025 RepID=UPI000CA1FF93|nr:LURP-one-related family protein [Kitasatospora sp. MMS16-BH015]AUG78834.1 hypothetical protein CFP65_4072 [Kitasatospora sp. MMS16-BH015]